MTGDDWVDGYDLDGVLARGDPTPRIVQGRAVGLDDGREFASAVELAESFGDVIFEPTRWPDGATMPRYVHSAPGPFTRQERRSYRIVAELPGHEALLLINGTSAPVPHVAGEQGWFEIPELAAVGGIGHWDGRGGHVVVARGRLNVHVVMFPSVAEAVAVAKSLRPVVAGKDS